MILLLPIRDSGSVYTIKPRFWNNPRFWNTTFAGYRNFYFINHLDFGIHLLRGFTVLLHIGQLNGLKNFNDTTPKTSESWSNLFLCRYNCVHRSLLCVICLNPQISSTNNVNARVRVGRLTVTHWRSSLYSRAGLHYIFHHHWKSATRNLNCNQKKFHSILQKLFR